MKKFSIGRTMNVLALLFVSLFFQAVFSQNCGYFSFPDTTGWRIPLVPSTCSGSIIRTDPYWPINTENWTRANTFNWIDPNADPNSFWEEYCLNSGQLNYTHIKTPWSQDNNLAVSHLTMTKDRYPQDGWELVKYDLGYTQSGVPAGTGVPYPYIVLYNRFTGRLRVFVAINEINYPFNVVQISLLHSLGTMSSNLDLSTAFTATQDGVTSLSDFIPNATFVSAARFFDTPTFWMYADFNMMYDPCVCSFNSKLKFEVSLISEALITMTSTSTGSIIPDETILELDDPTNKNTYKSDDGQHTWGWKDIAGFNEKAVQKSAKAFKDMNDFSKTMFDVIDKSGMKFEEKEGKLQDIADAIADLKLPAFLKDGLKALPYVSSAISLLDFFIAGGEEDPVPQQIKLPPMAIEFNSTYKGEIVTTQPKTSITFFTPGGNEIGPLELDYPLYNKPLGILHLVNTPELKAKTSIGNFSTHYVIDQDDSYWDFWDVNFPHNTYYFNQSQSYGVDPFGQNPFGLPTLPNGNPQAGGGSFTQYTFKFDNDIDFVINPATEFKEHPELVAALFVEIVDGNSPTGIGFVRNQINQNLNFTMYNEGLGVYRTRYVPLAAIKRLTAEFATAPGMTIKRIYLKVAGNFERGDAYVNANAQNVLWSANFAVNIMPPPVNYNWSSPFLNVVENVSFNSSQVLTGNVTAWENITIGSNANLTSPVPVIIRAGNGVTILPGATIGPNITIEHAMPNGQDPLRGPMRDSGSDMALSNFCASSSYNTIARTNKTDDTDEPTVSEAPFKLDDPGAPTLVFYPNPTQGQGLFELTLLRPDRVSLRVFNIMGQPVTTIWSDKELPLGVETYPFNLSSLPAGLYLAVLETSQGRQTIRIVKE